MSFNAQGDLFVATEQGYIDEFTPGGVESTFASGLGLLYGVTFDTSGNMYVASWGTQSILEFTPGGAESTFASGLDGPVGISFDSAGNLIVANYSAEDVLSINPAGVATIIDSGYYPGYSSGVDFGSAPSVPEPTSLALAGLGGLALLLRKRN